MKLYDETIRKIRALLSSEKQQLLHDATAWPVVSDRSMILRSDMAYELGGGSLPALGVTLVTASKDLVPGDGVFLTGTDLPEIDADTPFARIALVRVGEDTLGEGKKLYRAIRNLEYTRYHFYPEGFMQRSPEKRSEFREDRQPDDRGLSQPPGGGGSGNPLCDGEWIPVSGAGSARTGRRAHNRNARSHDEEPGHGLRGLRTEAGM